MTKLTDVEGIGEVYAGKLVGCGLMTQEQLLDLGATVLGRRTISEESGISSKLILNWVNRADLARVKGVGSEYADLLECSGVDTVPELAQRNPLNLHNKMVEVNEEKKLVRSLPSVNQVTDWVEQAKMLGRVIHY
ncbi:MAG: ferredoxin [Porticoccaceae bacterium]|nr:MAG: ferredoxin [Porticoccaceae bacterium]